MSGPIHEQAGREDSAWTAELIEVREGRTTELGGMAIARVLPTKGRRTVGAWCFVDLMSPGDIENPKPMEIGPHPHIGLSTVTWLFDGSALHGDSLGTEQLIRPGELNLMTAGHGIAHSELGIRPAGLGERAGDFVGAQMWIAQPESTRHGGSRFEHLSELPTVDLGSGEARVFVGSLGSAVSPARTDTELVGADLTVETSVEIATEAAFEYALVPLDRPMKIGDAIVEPGSLGITSTGLSSFRIEVNGGRGRALLLGGVPLGERVQMWWNFVARTREELTAAWLDWRDHNDDRFGPVPSDLEPMNAPPPPWVR